MPITNGKYVSPIWINNTTPAINETELNAMSDTLEKLDKTNFVPQLLVDATVTGTTVTVTNGSSVFTKAYNGSTLTFNLDSFGLWTVTMTQGSQTSGAITVNVSEVKQYSVTLAFFSASIIVNYPAGATVTATSGNITLTAPDTSGTHTFVVPMAGTWVINITSGSNVVTTNVIISSEGQVKNVVVNSFGTTASVSPLTGVNYETGTFDNYSWSYSLLTKIAKAISDNSAITDRTTAVYIDDGADHYKLQLGDNILFVIGETVTSVIVGFNHDQLASSTAYGEATATGMAGISVGMANCLKTKYPMESTDSNTGGWGNSLLRTTLQEEIWDGMISSLKNIIKTVKKSYNIGGGSSTISSSNDTLFIPSSTEITGDTYYLEGKQYAYYLAGNSQLKTVDGVLSEWWLRTPNGTQYYEAVGSSENTYEAIPCSDNAGVSVMCCF